MERQEGSGFLMRNQHKEGADNRPDYTGKIMLGGVDKRIAGWIRKAKDGQTFLSLKVSDLQGQKPAAQPKPTLDDKVPF